VGEGKGRMERREEEAGNLEGALSRLGGEIERPNCRFGGRL